MNRLIPVIAAAMAGALACSGALADPPARAQADAYVSRVAVGSHAEQMARWREPICPLVSGLAQDQAEYLLERLSTIAREVGAPLGTTECSRPNLFVVAADDPKALLSAWADRDPELFGVRSGAELDRVIAADRPVRVWRNVSFAPSNDRMAATTSPAFPGAAYGQASKPVLNWVDQSRVKTNASRAIWGAAVVLGPGVGKAKIAQLADYIALTTFAEVNLDAGAGQDESILALFEADAAAPAGLSRADEAFLKALYDVRPDLVSQRAAISERMARSVRR